MNESNTTQEVFDRIASGWYGFRHRTIFRTELEALADRWQKGRLLNIGCGHGPDFVPFKGSFELYGVDFSIEMLKLAQKYARKFDFAPQIALSDMRYLPFKDGSFDYAISVAAYHHIDDRDGRLASFRELKRILKPGGEAFVTVWNRWQPKFWSSRRNTLVPWRIKDTVLYRYYYLFSYGEIEKLFRQSGLEIIRSLPESSYRFPVKYFSRNICLLLKKPS
jgi:tRNA (uracil-5-)-methyltransferase TRM9